MSERTSQYLNEVHPVAKEPKTLKLVEQSIDRVVFGFEATFDEVAEFLSQTYCWGASKVEIIIKIKRQCPKYRIMLLAECVYDADGEWSMNGNLFGAFDSWVTGLSETGEIIEPYAPVFLGLEDDLFHFFGLDIYEEIQKMLPLVNETFSAGGKVVAEMEKSELINAEIDISEISEISIAGKMAIQAAKRQSMLKGYMFSKAVTHSHIQRYFANIWQWVRCKTLVLCQNWTNHTVSRKDSFSPNNGKITVRIGEAGDEPSDDVLMVKLVSKISWRERSLKYGMNGLNESDMSGIMSTNGLPIPTKEYLDKMEARLDDTASYDKYREIFVSHESAKLYLLGKMSGAMVINQLGERIQYFCDECQFEIA